jgi:hypothetical protein
LVSHVESAFVVAALELVGVAGGVSACGGKQPAVGAAEAQGAAGAGLDYVAAFVDDAVVVGAELNQV